MSKVCDVPQAYRSPTGVPCNYPNILAITKLFLVFHITTPLTYYYNCLDTLFKFNYSVQGKKHTPHENIAAKETAVTFKPKHLFVIQKVMWWWSLPVLNDNDFVF